MSELTDLNVIRAGSRVLLLTLAGGSAVHLAGEARDGEPGCPAAAHPRYLQDLEQAYDRAALTRPRWSPAALCGRAWHVMASEDARCDLGPAAAPTCRRCLALMDRLFPPPEPDGRLATVVAAVVDTVLEHGSAEIRGVPGDQQAALRSQARTAVRQRSGYPVRTVVIDSMVVVVCEPISRLYYAAHSGQILDAVASMYSGQPPRPLPTPWRLYWDDWAALG